MVIDGGQVKPILQRNKQHVKQPRHTLVAIKRKRNNMPTLAELDEQLLETLDATQVAELEKLKQQYPNVPLVLLQQRLKITANKKVGE